MTLVNKTVVVTGAASGIGHATALRFSRQGARVALCDLNAAELAHVATTISQAGGEARIVELNASSLILRH
jgi:3-oxoacyl-[acyl-carrier protein] reductase